MSNDNWATPQWLFDELNKEFDFLCDVCADTHNHKCAHFFDIKANGLAKSWTTRNWCNPPYSNQMPWAVRAVMQASQGKQTVMLAMCDTSTEFFKYCYAYATQIRLLSHRIQFDGAKGSPRFASMLVIFDYPKWTAARAYADIVLADYRYAKEKQ